MADDNLDNLQPEERIKKLKELEEKKKKEIAEAQQKMKETEAEMTERDEWKRKVPIPEVAKEGTENLSEAEKEVLKAHHGLQEKKKVEEGEEKEEPRRQEAESLEEAVARERINIPAELIGSDYAERLSREPMEKLQQGMKNIYQAVEEKGYVSTEESRKIEYLSAATERKLEDVEAGKYSFTEQVAEAAMLTKQIGNSLRRMYKGSSDGGNPKYIA